MAKRIKIPKETKKEKIHLFDYYDVLGMGSMSSARIEFFSNEKVIVETFLKLKNGEEVNFETMSEILFNWAKKWIC